MKIFQLGWLFISLALAGCGGGTQPVSESDNKQLATMETSAGAAVKVTPDAYYRSVQQMYIAFYGRPGDPEGLDFYAQHLANANAPTNLRDLIENRSANATVNAVVNQFGESDESSKLYTGDTTAFLKAVYLNVLNREPDPDGLAFWKNAIDQRTVSRTTAALWILVSASAPGNTDGLLVTAKTEAAIQFTRIIKNQLSLRSYADAAAGQVARRFLRDVHADQSAASLIISARQAAGELLMRQNPQDRLMVSGVVALGRPVADADVFLFDQGGLLGVAKSAVDGSFTVLKDNLLRELQPPYLVEAKFELAGRKIDLFSIETDGSLKNTTMNVTPLSDMITRSYVPKHGKPDPYEHLDNDITVLGLLKDNLIYALGPLLPKKAPDPIRTPMVADPRLDPLDYVIDRLDFETTSSGTILRAKNGVELARLEEDDLKLPVLNSDVQVISNAEMAIANSARGVVSEPVAPHVNEAPLGIPAGLRAVKTGGLKFKLTWEAVPGATHYYLYENKTTPPTIVPGRYNATDKSVMPSYAVDKNSLEIDYQVDGPGTYYWIVAAATVEDKPAIYNIGRPSNPVSLTWGTDGSAGSPTSPGTVWERVLGASGNRTELAIGGITNEPDNRVYACEKRGSSVAGLYKGTISNNVVKWDAVYGMPDTRLTISGNKLVWEYIDVAGSLPTTYERGHWSGECGPLEAVPPTKLVVVVPADASAITGVTLDGQNVPLTRLTNGAPRPDCSTSTSTLTLQPPARSNSTGKYYTLLVNSRFESVDAGGHMQNFTHETTWYEWYFKPGVCNVFTVDWGPLGFTLVPF